MFPHLSRLIRRHEMVSISMVLNFTCPETSLSGAFYTIQGIRQADSGQPLDQCRLNARAHGLQMHEEEGWQPARGNLCIRINMGAQFTTSPSLPRPPPPRRCKDGPAWTHPSDLHFLGFWLQIPARDKPLKLGLPCNSQHWERFILRVIG